MSPGKPEPRTIQVHSAGISGHHRLPDRQQDKMKSSEMFKDSIFRTKSPTVLIHNPAKSETWWQYMNV